MQLNLPKRKDNEPYKDKSASGLEKAVIDSFYNTDVDIHERILSTYKFVAEDIDIYVNNKDVDTKQEFKKQQSHKGLYVIEKTPTSVVDPKREKYNLILRNTQGKPTEILQEENTDIVLTAQSGHYEGTTYVKDSNGHTSQSDTNRSISLVKPSILIPRTYTEEIRESREELSKEMKRRRQKNTYIGIGAGVTTLGFSLAALPFGIVATGVLPATVGYFTKKVAERENSTDVYSFLQESPSLFAEKEQSMTYQDPQHHQL